MISYNTHTGKTTYSDGDSLSGDLGDKVRKGDKKALQELEEFAESIDLTQPHSQARALYELGEVYFNGFCEVERSTEKALKYFTKAAELNDELALIQLGKFYRDGKQGFKQDGQKTLEYFIKAAELGKQNGYELAAEIYREGKCVKADGYKAIDYFEKSSNFKQIAEIYRYGKACVKPDPQKAIEYFLKYESANCRRQNPSHEMSDFEIFLDNSTRAEAFRNVAEIYYSLNDGQKALEYFLKADECGDEWAYINVAGIYREGKGNLKPDGVKLIEYLTKKLEQNEPPDDLILYDIAKAYEEGCGSLEPNMQKAIDFYRKAAALGNDDAKKELAIRHLL